MYPIYSSYNSIAAVGSAEYTNTFQYYLALVAGYCTLHSEYSDYGFHLANFFIKADSKRIS